MVLVVVAGEYGTLPMLTPQHTKAKAFFGIPHPG
jgi:hypothetical protein